MKLNLSADAVLKTTRAVRKRLDLSKDVPVELLKECLNLSLQSPTASAQALTHYILIGDDKNKEKIASLYRNAFEIYQKQKKTVATHHPNQNSADRMVDSAQYLAANMHKVPWLLIPVMVGRYKTSLECASVYGSILPSVWSFMLAARERSLGTCWTTLHLMFEKEAAEVLEIPFENYTQVALIPIAFSRGTDFKEASRKDLSNFLHMETW